MINYDNYTGNMTYKLLTPVNVIKYKARNTSLDVYPQTVEILQKNR